MPETQVWSMSQACGARVSAACLILQGDAPGAALKNTRVLAKVVPAPGKLCQRLRAEAGAERAGAGGNAIEMVDQRLEAPSA